MRKHYDKFAEEIIKLSYKYHFTEELTNKVEDYSSKMKFMTNIFKSVNNYERNILLKENYQNIDVDINKLKTSILHHDKIGIFNYSKLCFNDINLFIAMVKVTSINKKYFYMLYYNNRLLNKLALSKEITKLFSCVLDINKDIKFIYRSLN